MNISNLVIEPVAGYHCKTGENPLWDERRQLFFWEDIPTGRLFQFNPATNKHRIIFECPRPIGGFTFQENGDLLLFRDTDIARFNPDTGECQSLFAFHDEGVPRFNDVIACPDGSVLAGTMGKDLRGGLYHVTSAGQITNLFRGTNCANGMAFTADRQTFYWTDSTNKHLYAFDFSPDTSSLSNRRLLIDSAELQGVPDGMTIDTEGRLYSTRWGGFAIYIHNPDGSLIRKIDMPVERISSCTFAGPNLADLYVTTANPSGEITSGGASPGGDGALYRIRGLNFRGRAEFRSRILLP
ncbi:MAG: SMP-30/gluconolactonase/LRE family protein [Phycisphaerales bacterium]